MMFYMFCAPANLKECVVRSLFSLLFLVMLLFARSARAELVRVSLPEAVGQALRSSHLLRAALHEKTAAAAAVAAGRSRYLPRITLEESAALTNSPTRAFMMKLDQGRFSLAGDLNQPPTTGDFRTTLTLEQPLFDGRLATNVTLAKKEEEGRDLALERRREEVVLGVVNAYLDLQQAKLELQLAEQGVADAREHQRLAAARNSAGVGLRSDELRARAFVSEMELQLISAGNAVQLAMLRLSQATGHPPGERVDIREPYAAPVMTRNQAELAQLAAQNRPELRQLAKELERAEAGVVLARRAWLPTLYGSASYQLNDREVPFGRDNDAWLVGAVLRWELFDGGERSHGTDKATALQGSAAEYLAALRQEVELEVTESYLRREETGKRLEVARHAELDAAEGVRLLSRRFENSLALLVEVLDAQTALNRARAQVAATEVAYARATARLYFTAGILLKEVMP